MNRLGAAGLALLLVGVLVAGGGVYFSLAQESGLSDVRDTEGTVVSASVEPIEGGYYPNVTYRYGVDGTDYASSNVFPPAGQRRATERDDAREVVAGYAAGQTVTVYYPAGRPADASLRAPRSPGPVFAVGFGLVAAAFGFAVAVAGRQREQDRAVRIDDSPVPDEAVETEEGEVDDVDADAAGDATE